ncbi:hypothetical protein NDU88_008262 [Pleurodeles waltl]|uniref:Uncharacterized protein n=1 Tax=Pleurodeles waltl TaxID=8319 RepID=A0AAV7PP10_PLEWA|nr:hypothetical protein NDU88_008262 [Pleurodeles waltl]
MAEDGVTEQEQAQPKTFVRLNDLSGALPGERDPGGGAQETEELPYPTLAPGCKVSHTEAMAGMQISVP